MSDSLPRKRGGLRSGAGRKPDPTVRSLVRLRPEELEEVKALAAEQGVSTHAWMVAAVRAALETATCTKG